MPVRVVTRQSLYEEVWAEPIVKVAARYGVSDVGFAKACRQMLIPLPPRGHWAKLRAGKRSDQTKLPAAKPDTPTEARFHMPDADALEARAKGKEEVAALAGIIRSSTLPSLTDLPPPELHPLAQAAARRLSQKSGWTHHKGLRSSPSEILNLEVTEGAIDRAALIASLLLNALAALGATVEIDTEKRETLMNFRGALLEFSISEHVARSNHVVTADERRATDRYHRRSERGQWRIQDYPSIPQYDWTPSGVLTLTLGRWPARSWRDTPKTQLQDRIVEIVTGTIVLAAEVVAKDDAQARQVKAAKEAKERYEDAMQRIQAERVKLEKLERDASSWERAARIRTYVGMLSEAYREQGRLNMELEKWLAWAAAKADWLDPSIEVSDIILDAPEPKKPSGWLDR